jgi:hypothetical protein
MTTQKAARASPELRKAPLSPRYSRNYTTPRGTTGKTLIKSKSTVNMPALKSLFLLNVCWEV